MGTVTTTLDYRANSGNQFVQEGVLTLSTSYAQGGDSCTARLVGLGYVNSMQMFSSTSGWSTTLSSTTTLPGASFKILALGPGYVVATATTGANPVYIATSAGTNLLFSTASASVTVAGNTLMEATAATNLSGVAVRFRAEGF